MKKVIDDQYDKIIEETAKELGYSKELVDKVIKSLVSWQITSIINEEYAAYIWDKFGTWSFFNRKNSKYHKEVDVYNNKRARKNKHMKVIIPDGESAEDTKLKNEMIEEIISFHPNVRPRKYIKYAYLYNSKDIKEYIWNINYMKSDSVENVKHCLELIKQKVSNNG